MIFGWLSIAFWIFSWLRFLERGMYDILQSHSKTSARMLEPSMTSKTGRMQVKSMIDHWYRTLLERMVKNLANTLSILLMRWFKTKVWTTLGKIWLVVFMRPSASRNRRGKWWVFSWMTYIPRSKIWVKKKFKMQSIFSKRSWGNYCCTKGHTNYMINESATEGLWENLN